MASLHKGYINPRAMLLFGLALIEFVASWSPSSISKHQRSSDLRSRMLLVAFSTSENQGGEYPPVERQDGNTTDSILARVNKKIRVAKAQSEIDRILAGPDAPFDAESELKKVVSIAASPVVAEMISENNKHENNNVEETSDHMETLLYKAVREKDFALAATKKEELNQMQMDDALAVLQVNSAFYRSFSQRDTKRMNALWVPDENSICINPSSPPLIGGKAIAASWDQLFSSSSKYQSWVEPSNIRVAMRGATTAVVTCDELVFARCFVRGQKRKSEKINTLVATNIFRKIGTQWLMAHHHASWHHESDASRYALNAATMNRLGSTTTGGDDKAQQIESGIKMDGILGAKNFGPVLGDQMFMMKGNNQNGKMRVVRGNLLDLLGGNIKDLLGKNSDSSDAIFEFHELKRGEDEEDEEEDDDEEYEDDNEMYASDDGEAASIVKRFSDYKTNAQDKLDKARLTLRRQSCIRLLRQLCGKGTISPKQKRVLLTDIISCSAKEEASLVEAAYELLYDGDDLEAAEEDFADQCRVLAGSLSDQ
jgi:SnoaL-like domain